MSSQGVNGGIVPPLGYIRTRRVTLDGTAVGTGPLPIPPAHVQFILECIDDNTGYTWQFEVQGGSTSSTTDGSRFYSVMTGSLINLLSIAQTQPSPTVTVVTPPADSGGRTYEINFYAGTSQQPTIELTAGAALATTLTVIVMDYSILGIL